MTPIVLGIQASFKAKADRGTLLMNVCINGNSVVPKVSTYLPVVSS